MILDSQAWQSLLDVHVCEISSRLAPVNGEAMRDEAWWANELRSALGSALRQVMCATPSRPCERCRFKDECGFLRIWQPTRGDGERGPEYRTPSWILECLRRPDSLDVTIRLFGPAVSAAWQWRVALELAAARGLGRARQRLRALEELRQAQPRRLTELCPPQPPEGQSLVVDLVSPLRLVHGGEAVSAAPPFPLLVKAVERRARLAILAWLGVAVEPIAPARLALARVVGIVADSTQLVRLRRYSARQAQSMALAGIVGSIEYSTGWEVFWPLLRLAPLLHVGKGATLGFGRVAFGQGRTA
ncbi:MAG TPA: CRISPR system precrRNA processing endoribonuclease RAMP protein Cas6 [Thermoanaerobaculaceae bacterium]|nr:CRISPR system precrRNA processing endoribonuclease RAMP protein Cas6 [Thermoanaerobaculaceae bacterium]HRS15467.1 CRISPR system precrRNA processing endoribonuclease RAMP protein Cas6 [Thermoanaerobaculaceae bacterium]